MVSRAADSIHHHNGIPRRPTGGSGEGAIRRGTRRRCSADRLAPARRQRQCGTGARAPRLPDRARQLYDRHHAIELLARVRYEDPPASACHANHRGLASDAGLWSQVVTVGSGVAANVVAVWSQAAELRCLWHAARDSNPNRQIRSQPDAGPRARPLGPSRPRWSWLEAI